MKADLHIRSENSANKFTMASRNPIVVGFAGVSKTGKISTFAQIQSLLKHWGFRTEVVVERASIRLIRDKKHSNFNVWTACTMIRKISRILMLCFVSLIASACSEDHENVEQQGGTSRTKGTIAPHALPTYDAKNWPKWFRIHGAERMKDAEALAAAAAEKMISSGKCPHLDYVDLSDRSRVGEFVFFGDCSGEHGGNEGRIYVSESDLKLKRSIRSEAELAWDHGEAHITCRNMIQQNVAYPDEVDIHDFIGKSVREIETTHRVVIRLDFDAKIILELKEITLQCATSIRV